MNRKYRYVTWVANTLAITTLVGGAVLLATVFATYLIDKSGLHPLLQILLLLLAAILLTLVSYAFFWVGDAVEDYLMRHPGGWLPRRTIDFKR